MFPRCTLQLPATGQERLDLFGNTALGYHGNEFSKWRGEIRLGCSIEEADKVEMGIVTWDNSCPSGALKVKQGAVP